MTFSIAARCERTGAFGIGITTGSICVGARCPFVLSATGAMLTQHSTDPGLGLRGIELLKTGKSAQQVIDELVKTERKLSWRQLAAVDRNGTVAHFTGDDCSPERGGHAGPNCVAIGNLLRRKELPKAMIDGFMERPQDMLADRLLRALDAGIEAGSEVNPLRSATLLVAERFPFPEVNLRVDWHEEPVAKLRRIWNLYKPDQAMYMQRVTDPDNAKQT
ncbi:MAG: DUF1028 domain-containing protein [Alphaproteobacteria bacterium]